MWLLFFRNQAYAPCAFEDTNGCHCSGPVGSDRRGWHQRGDTPLWGQQKQYLSLARATQWRKKTLLLFALTHQFLQQMIEGDAHSARGRTRGGDICDPVPGPV